MAAEMEPSLCMGNSTKSDDAWRFCAAALLRGTGREAAHVVGALEITGSEMRKDLSGDAGGRAPAPPKTRQPHDCLVKARTTVPSGIRNRAGNPAHTRNESPRELPNYSATLRVAAVQAGHAAVHHDDGGGAALGA